MQTQFPDVSKSGADREALLEALCNECAIERQTKPN